jgi:hypothetical protein
MNIAYDYQLPGENIKTDAYRRIVLEFDEYPTDQQVLEAITEAVGEVSWYFNMGRE